MFLCAELHTYQCVPQLQLDIRVESGATEEDLSTMTIWQRELQMVCFTTMIIMLSVLCNNFQWKKPAYTIIEM